MSIFSTHPALRWAVPGVAVRRSSSAAPARPVSSRPRPTRRSPPRTAAQLLVDVQNARLDGLSGTVVQRADLGLPALPGIGGRARVPGSAAGSSDLSSLVAGTHTLRLWYAGPDRTRVALLGTSGESDVIRNGKDVWLWSSQDKSATHTHPARRAAHDAKAAPAPGATGLPTSPQQAADLALKAISPSTTVTHQRRRRGGRPLGLRAGAHARRSRPRCVARSASRSTASSTCRCGCRSSPRARPTRRSRSASPRSTSAGRTRRSSPSTRRPGTKVTERTAPRPTRVEAKPADAPPGKPKVVGTGWTTVVVATLPQKASGSAPGDQQS